MAQRNKKKNGTTHVRCATPPNPNWRTWGGGVYTKAAPDARRAVRSPGSSDRRGWTAADELAPPPPPPPPPLLPEGAGGRAAEPPSSPSSSPSSSSPSSMDGCCRATDSRFSDLTWPPSNKNTTQPGNTSQEAFTSRNTCARAGGLATHDLCSSRNEVNVTPIQNGLSPQVTSMSPRLLGSRPMLISRVMSSPFASAARHIAASMLRLYLHAHTWRLLRLLRAIVIPCGDRCVARVCAYSSSSSSSASASSVLVAASSARTF